MVEVYASVVDRKGQPVQNLQKGDFEVAEDGVKQTVEVFQPQASGMTVALLIDTTGSMAPNLPQVKNAITSLLGMLGADDSIGLFSFSSRLTTLQPLTRNKSEVMSALLSPSAEGKTALCDALAQLARDLSRTGGKKVISAFHRWTGQCQRPDPG